VDTKEIQSKLKGSIGEKLLFYKTINSTNLVAMEIAEKTPEGTVVIADSQENGRGRLGRTWISPPHANIYMSIILKPEIGTQDITLLTIMASVACAKALGRATGLKVTIKWPNDLIVSDKKIGGILTELTIQQKKIVSAVVGIGINVNMEIDDFPEDLKETATSVQTETGKTFYREGIVSQVLNELDIWYTFLKKMDRKKLLSEWQINTSTLGKKVKVIIGKETLEGFAESIENDGRLVLRLQSGETRRISSGDLILLR
jgi:BirA family biotin operon repressor/biotin-[acetyl-CoA-carboxylase] ligase